MSDAQLIELVERYPILYDTSVSQYRDLTARNMAWESIADLLNTTGHDCKVRWSKLRNCYTNSRKRRRKKGDLAASMTPWKFESQMEFLLPYLETRDTDINDDDSQFHEKPKLLDVSDNTVGHRSSYHKPKSNEHNLLDDMMYVLDPPKDTKRKITELDENDHFFLSMSKQLKRLPMKDQSNIKFQLHKLIHECEMKILTNDVPHKFEE